MSRHALPAGHAPWLRPGLVVLLALLATAAASGVPAPGVRVLALLPFLLLGPGLGLVGLLDVPDPWREAAFVIGVSLAVDLVVATALGYYGAGTAVETLGVLVGIAVLGAAGQLARTVVRRSHRSAAP